VNFFIDNPFLVIVLIAVISSFFKKKKENPAQNHNRPKQAGKAQQRPQRSFVEEARDLFKEFVSDETRPIPRQTEKKVRRPKRSEETAEASLVRLEPSSAGLQEAVLETMQTVNPSAALTPDTTPKKKLETSEDHLIDSVIWSEILGPPRAKKPYMRKNFRS
jgi:hypothetical protein